MSETTPRLGLPLIAAGQAQKHVPVNEALTRIDALMHLSVVSRGLTAPPPTPAQGERHIVGAGATGSWAGRDLSIASYDAGWSFLMPREGWLVWDAGEADLLLFDGSAWEVFAPGAAAGGGDLQNLALLGVGGTADAVNPFLAKLNNALWTALPVEDEGNGDLRLVMNKEAGANVLSLVMQSNFSGRAEIGLVGDEDFLFKVSADGVVWREALRISRETGRPSFPQGGVREQLFANRTYYVRADGSNDNHGLGNTAAGAFKTVQRALEAVYRLDLNGCHVTIHMQDGTWTASAMASGPFVGSGTVTIRGNPAPGAVVWNITDGRALSCIDGAKITVTGIEFRVTNSGTGVTAEGAGAQITIGQDVRFGPSDGTHCLAYGGGKIFGRTPYAITGNAIYHVVAQAGGSVIDVQGIAVTLAGTPVFSGQFARSTTGSLVMLGYNTYSGSATGMRYQAVSGGGIDVNGGGANYLPGSTPGSAAAPGWYA